MMKLILFFYIIIELTFLQGYSQKPLTKDSCIVVNILKKVYGEHIKLPQGPICSWKEVKCSDIDGNTRVTLLRLVNITNTIPPNINDLDQLKYLYLHRKRESPMTKLPRELWKIKNLEHLWISWGKLDSIPSDIKELKHLKLLFLNSNKLTSLPITLEKMEQLEYLSLTYNSFFKYPEVLNKLSNLKYLNLADNPFSSFPPETGNNWQQLEAIYADQVPFEKVPETILDLPELKIKGFDMPDQVQKINEEKKQTETNDNFYLRDITKSIQANFSFTNQDTILFCMTINFLGVLDTIQGKAYKLPDSECGEEIGSDTSKGDNEIFGAHTYQFTDTETNSGFILRYDYKTNNRTNIIFTGIYFIFNNRNYTLIKANK